jgi:sterol 24-C-methyltransferase
MMATKAVPKVTEVSHLDELTNKTIDHYTKYYDSKTSDVSHREESALDVAHTYYDLVTDFYEYGYGTSFHFSPVYNGKSMAENLELSEREIAKLIDAKPGHKLLDVGCGVGGPARTIAKYSGAHVTGITCSEYQVQRGNFHTQKAGLEHLCTFDLGNYCNMEMYDDNSFDGAYALEAICHTGDPLDPYKEVYRVLKPGGIFVDSNWVVTDKFEPGNPAHEKIKHDIMVGDALPDLRTANDLVSKLKETGFEVIDCEDLALSHGDLPWYIYLSGKSWFSLESFRASWVGRTVTHCILKVVEMIGLVPQGTTSTHTMLLTGADGLIAGGKAKIFTPMLRMVARKPHAN